MYLMRIGVNLTGLHLQLRARSPLLWLRARPLKLHVPHAGILARVGGGLAEFHAVWGFA
jgi:hypothetical protein